MGARLAVVGRDPHRLATLPGGFRVVANDKLGKGLMVVEMADDRMRIHFGATREEVPKQGGDYDWIKLGLVISTAKKMGVQRAAIAVRPWVTVEHIVNAANLLAQAGLGTVLTHSGVELIGGTGKGISIGTSGPPPIRGRVKLGGAEATGDLDVSIIRRYIQRNRARIRFCYDKHLKTHPKAEGKMIVSFTITPTGAVMKAKASGFAPVDACVAVAIGQIKFPRPKSGSVLVRYPFSFGPGN